MYRKQYRIASTPKDPAYLIPEEFTREILQQATTFSWRLSADGRIRTPVLDAHTPTA